MIISDRLCAVITHVGLCFRVCPEIKLFSLFKNTHINNLNLFNYERTVLKSKSLRRAFHKDYDWFDLWRNVMYRQIILVINKTINFCNWETIKINPIGETNEQVCIFTLLFLCYSKFYPFMTKKSMTKLLFFNFEMNGCLSMFQ